MQYKIRANRKFNWVSSSEEKNSALLYDLNSGMIDFYSNFENRDLYQKMAEDNDNDLDDPNIVTLKFINYLQTQPGRNLLEVGCGSGRTYQFIKRYLDKFTYTGIEVSKTAIRKNQIKYPAANWLASNVYNIPQATESIDICFSFYVLEHLVFPEKALNEMLRTIKKGGLLILVFPDFAASGRFASQFIGLSDESTAMKKLKKGRIIDAMVSLYDSRIRLPNALKNAFNKIGAFPVNLTPKCLSGNNIELSPDIDAVYIASKNEIENWAKKKGYTVVYPAGKHGHFSEHAFVSIQKMI